MPLDHGYGVVIGQMVEHWRDDPDQYGRWFHGHIKVNTPVGDYECAVDVDTPSQSVGVEWRVVSLAASDVAVLSAMSDGYHPLASTPTSGAIDYVRTAAFQPHIGCMTFVYDPRIEELKRWLQKNPALYWKTGTGEEALNVLEPLLDGATRVFVFGEPFSGGGLGIHNVHQNQGDPVNSQWGPANGIWQDGATIMAQADGAYVAFLNKFSTQAYKTDENGNPIP